MAEKIEEMTVGNVKREEIKAENRVYLLDVIFANGEKITVSGNDIAIVDRFCLAREEIIALAEEMDGKESALGEDDFKEKVAVRLEFSKKATAIMDDIFGDGATKKYFGDVLDAIPKFMPDAECFIDYWDNFIPVIERMSDHKIKLEKLASSKRMAKYQPQDYKREDSK